MGGIVWGFKLDVVTVLWSLVCVVVVFVSDSKRGENVIISSSGWALKLDVSLLQGVDRGRPE